MSSELQEIEGRIASLTEECRSEYADLHRASQFIGSERLIAEANIDRLEKEISELELKRLALIDRVAERSGLISHGLAQAEAEDRAFWFRRFHTSLALANGGAFAAIASKVFDGEHLGVIAAAAWLPMGVFALGMMVAGTIPVALFLKRPRLPWGLALVSAALLIIGLGSAIWAVMWNATPSPLDLWGWR